MSDFFCGLDNPIVETTKGKLRGFLFDGVYHFQGIRYAKAKRFEMPQPVEAWEGVRDAMSYGMICPVLSEPMPTGEVMTPHRFWPSSEHCQYLNVWSSSLDETAKKPVMFWIHGGGYAAGSSIEQECYDGFNLAKLDDVVFVSVNHRLNAFGYLDVSDFGEEYANSYNVGMADLVEALRWVRDNIAKFGGDPENVTILGQSGGGGKVTVLGQIPEADGLFAKAIVMSGVIPEGDFGTDVVPKELVEKVMDELHIEDHDIKKLAKTPVPQYIWAMNRAIAFFGKQGKRVNWSPKPNDYYKCDPVTEDFTAHSLTVPTMVGTVIAEFGFPMQVGDRKKLSVQEREKYVKEYYGEEGGQAILDAFRKVYPGKNEIYATDLECMFLPDTVKYVKKKAAEASAPVYNYIFAKVFDYDMGRAAWHCSDIPFFLHNAERIPICHQSNYRMLDRVMSGAFVNFARTGNPNVEGLPEWKPCEKDKTFTMVFDDTCYVNVNMQDELLPLIQKHKPPFEFDFGAPADDEEESGNAWVF
ncbi:carboxylesterase/lipase family protein [Agathobacter ruminis]|uniref:Carboxylic ester hydrolase n=1 Tax=Agathobacter ruminis TaxID=1712665 RepID=A0A2G3E518_9FIRM|nr:carboxylesterase family protein [Agathobacter ruminis]MDC7301135.1 carboxylesterase family protein [Agathobacter ruminis]PHU38354.1 carboxylesterase [Agathobacter ruminis]